MSTATHIIVVLGVLFFVSMAVSTASTRVGTTGPLSQLCGGRDIPGSQMFPSACMR